MAFFLEKERSFSSEFRYKYESMWRDYVRYNSSRNFSLNSEAFIVTFYIRIFENEYRGQIKVSMNVPRGIPHIW